MQPALKAMELVPLAPADVHSELLPPLHDVFILGLELDSHEVCRLRDEVPLSDSGLLIRNTTRGRDRASHLLS